MTTQAQTAAMEAAAEEIVNRLWERVATSYGLVAGASWPPAWMKELTLEVLSKHFPEPAVPSALVSELEDIVPTSWLDPLLTGEQAVITDGPYDGYDIENLLKAVKHRLDKVIAKAKQPEGKK